MTNGGQGDTTKILMSAREGDRGASAELMPLVYGELRALAGHYLSRERPDHTLQPTALVHEAYVKLVDQTRANWQDRAHFFAVAAEAMRRALVDHARKHGAAKRRSDGERITLDQAVALTEDTEVDFMALEDALCRLADLDARQARIVELKFFGGLQNKEAAEILGVSLRTVEGDWRMAKAWLRRAMGEARGV